MVSEKTEKVKPKVSSGRTSFRICRMEGRALGSFCKSHRIVLRISVEITVLDGIFT